MVVTTRFAPSPTGDLHVGGARTALYNWLMARHYQAKGGGKLVLRIEDTDTRREKEGAIRGILDGLAWLGIDHDDGPRYQTDRYDRYKAVVQQLLDQGKAYYCFHTKEYLKELRAQQLANNQKPSAPRTYRDLPLKDALQRIASLSSNQEPPVVRFKVPLDGKVSWADLVVGDDDLGTKDVAFANQELEDLVIQRSDGSPTYNFCVVVDDWDMNVSHVIRGTDHIPNTASQIHIFHALGASVPRFGHVPMIKGPDGNKLSKRHGAASVLVFRDQGYLPQALKNYLLLLGWSHGNQEIFSDQEMIDLFDIDNVSKSASTFNADKLNWMNQQYMKQSSPVDLVDPLQYQYKLRNIDTGDVDLTTIIPYYVDRAQTLKEMAEQTSWIFQTPTDYPPDAAKNVFRGQAKEFLLAVATKIAAVTDWELTALRNVVDQVVLENNASSIGKVSMPLRLALTGGAPSPSIDAVLWLLGKEKTLKSIEAAVATLR